MDGIDRVYDLITVLGSRRGPISTADLMARLECSRPTLHRTLTHLRDVYGVPIKTVRGAGYQFDRDVDDRIELPGLWFNPEELYALLAMQHLLSELGPGILSNHVEPFRDRIRELLDKATPHAKQFPAERIRILGPHRRDLDDHVFREVAGAVVRRRRMHITYDGRVRNRRTEREISPQRLVHYRNNWYLDAWCHRRRGLRTFALDRIRAFDRRDTPAREVPDTVLDAHLAASYGIFAGKAKSRARLRFSPERARWVADERWHPAQQGQFATDGSYELEVPFGDPRELIGEILRHGANVEVLGPKNLRKAVAGAFAAAAQLYVSTVETDRK